MAILNKRERMDAMLRIKDNAPTSEEHLYAWASQNKGMVQQLIDYLYDNYGLPKKVSVDTLLNSSWSSTPGLKGAARHSRRALSENGHPSAMIAACKRILGPLASDYRINRDPEAPGFKICYEAYPTKRIDLDTVLSQIESSTGVESDEDYYRFDVNDGFISYISVDENTSEVQFFFRSE